MFLDEIAARLVSEGIGILGTNIFLGAKVQVPKGSGPYVSIVETGGTGAVRTQNNTSRQRPTGQVTVRSDSYVTARTKIKHVYNALGGVNGLYNFTLNGAHYVSLTVRTEPIEVGMDDDNRSMLSFNFDAEKRPS